MFKKGEDAMNKSLSFFGSGSGFTQEHTNAYFKYKGTLVLIDLSMLNIYKALPLALDCENVVILVTHLHGDHASGIGLFAQELYYNHNEKCVIVLPERELIREDFISFMRIQGINDECYDIVPPHWIPRMKVTEVPTFHCPELEGKTFGYIIEYSDKYIIYSGDTTDFAQFASYLKEGAELYIDISVDYGKVHILYDDVKDVLIELAYKYDIYLMHIDNITRLKYLIKDTPLQLA